MIPDLLSISLHSCKIKSGSGLGTRLCNSKPLTVGSLQLSNRKWVNRKEWRFEECADAWRNSYSLVISGTHHSCRDSNGCRPLWCSQWRSCCTFAHTTEPRIVSYGMYGTVYAINVYTCYHNNIYIEQFVHSFIYSVVACDSVEWLVFSLFLQLLHQWHCSILWCLSWTHLCHPNRQCCHLCLGDWSYHQAHTKQTWPHQWKNELKNCHHTVHHNCRYHVPLWSDMALWCTNCHWNQRH